MHFKHSFGMIVHNGESFVAQAIKSIYDVAHEIIVVEGCEPLAHFMATSDGMSVDRTEEAINAVPDPEHKIRYIRAGRVGSKTEQCNIYMQHVTGDYIWELDSDELYLPEHVVAIDELLYEGKFEAAEIPFLHFWRNAYHIARGTSWEIPIRRIFKFQPGDRYFGHRPPELVRKKWKAMRLLSSELLREKGIYCYHYGFTDNQRTLWKVAYHCNRGLPWRDYFLDHWVGNTARHYNNLNQPVNRIETFSGKQPQPILDSMWGKTKSTSVLHVLPSWSNGGGCTCVRDLIYSSNLGYFDHGLYVSKSTYSGVPPLTSNFPFYRDINSFERVARKYDVLEFMFWHSTPELTLAIRMKKPRPKIVVVIPIYNDNSLRMYFDRFFLTDEEKREVDHVVFMSDKAVSLPENAGIDPSRISVVPWGPELIWAALDGYQWRTADPMRVGCIGPFNSATTIGNLPEILKEIKTPCSRYRIGNGRVANGAVIDLIGDGELKPGFQKRSNASMRWHGHLSKKDLLKMMSSWDVFAYPMKDLCYCASEMKIQEACASFVPIVIHPSTGLCEMGLDKCGVVCDKVSDVPDNVMKLFSEPELRRSYQHSARTHALKTMGAHTSTKAMELIYEQLT